MNPYRFRRLKANSKALEREDAAEIDTRRRCGLYRHLGISNDEIRLLVLHPARSKNKRLVADMEVRDLPKKHSGAIDMESDGGPWIYRKGSDHFFTNDGRYFLTESRCVYEETNRYEALSYVWGNQATPTSILVNGVRIAIGENLNKALRRLRHRRRKRIVWVDALCINQRDDAEKTIQVKLMSEIYRRSWRVLVWLGEESPEADGELAMKFFDWLALRPPFEAKSTLSDAIRHAKMPLSNEPIPADLQGACRKTRNLDRGTRERLEARHVHHFFERAWFGRRWIIQESCLACRETFYVGQSSMSWTTKHMIAAYNLKLDDQMSISTKQAVRSGLRLFTVVADPGPDTIESLWLELQEFHNSKCFDPRDRLATYQWRIDQVLRKWSHFNVDYRLGVEDNYAAFANAVITYVGREVEDLDRQSTIMSNWFQHNSDMLKGMLLAATYRQWSKDSAKILPSWIPDWRIQPFSKTSPRTQQANKGMSHETAPSRCLRFVVWLPGQNAPTVVDHTLHLHVQELSTLPSLPLRVDTCDNDIVLILPLEMDEESTYCSSETLKDALILRPTASSADHFRLVGVYPSLYAYQLDDSAAIKNKHEGPSSHQKAAPALWRETIRLRRSALAEEEFLRKRNAIGDMRKSCTLNII